ncbi:MAG: NAD-dependent epimerase/dehydratase family protein [Ruminococcaceae bacterium]|nr:NAD-dependent epimerase/dehydratase family protein [Oscillospiraceae bacterium]
MNFYGNETYKNAIRALFDKLPCEKNGILVTGASGLIGSLIVDTLLFANKENGCKFKVYAHGRSKEKLEKRFSYAKGKDIEFIIGDICQPIDGINEIDYIIHGASNADPRSYSLYPAQTLLINVIGAQNVLELAKKTGAKNTLLLSTFETYGKIEQSEKYSEEQFGKIDHNMIRACYPESKRCAEILFRCYSEQYGIKTNIARLGSVYGPTMAQNDSKAHAQFIRNALNGEDIVLKSEGKPIRSYVSVFDTVSGIFKVLFEGENGEAYNVSDDNCTASIAQVANTIAEICSKRVIFDLPDEIEKKGFSAPQNSILGGTKLKKLGWRAEYNVKNGLELTIKILKELSLN